MTEVICPLCDGRLYVDKTNHTIWCDAKTYPHEWLCINNSFCSRKAVEVK